jgi:hypothetical protein
MAFTGMFAKELALVIAVIVAAEFVPVIVACIVGMLQ